MNKSALCACFGYSRQALYKHSAVDTTARARAETTIIHAVQTVRKRQPNVGGRKLKEHLQHQDIHIGRDRLFDILRTHGLLIRPARNYHHTTDSHHRFRTYPNLIRGKTIDKPGQVYVSDITYIPTDEGFMYLFLITDLYSRMIVGYNLNRSLGIEGALAALKQAIRHSTGEALTHHSDRGIQYCSNDYIDLLKEHKIAISMTEENHVYENALAERVNGILKCEFIGTSNLPSMAVAESLIPNSIRIYNKERLHTSLGLKTPFDVHFSH